MANLTAILGFKTVGKKVMSNFHNEGGHENLVFMQEFEYHRSYATPHSKKDRRSALR